jgi:hypothetical protein
MIVHPFNSLERDSLQTKSFVRKIFVDLARRRPGISLPAFMNKAR